ncbi:hypothetical protein, conserved [Eimeria praecox]|uniref:Uncharacterized protein n=1 Tax=Eimeria praecox TaxID=51316 RepID=U6G4U0_9EIME|nr:hypothetical protein, conserved [Eimeria praecox]
MHSHKPCNSRFHETQGGMPAAPAGPSQPARAACEPALGYSLSKSSAAEGLHGKLNCGGDEAVRDAAAAPSNRPANWEVGAARPASHCASVSTNVDSETADNMLRASYSNSSFLGGAPSNSREWGARAKHGNLYRSACEALHSKPTTSAQPADGKGECGALDPHRDKCSLSLDGQLRQSSVVSLGSSWDAPHLSSSAETSTGEHCPAYGSLNASANPPEQCVATASRPPPESLSPCGHEVNPSWEEYEGCDVTQGNADGPSLERSTRGDQEGQEAPLRGEVPVKCATWSHLCGCVPPYKDCGNEREHSEQPTVSTSLDSSSSQLPSSSSPLGVPRPSCSCSPASDACDASATSRPGGPSSDESIQLSVSEESRCVTPQPPPTNCSVSEGRRQPEAHACSTGSHHRKAQLPGAPEAGSHCSAARHAVEFRAFGLLPSLPVLNIAARIIQRHWRRARYRLRPPSRAVELQEVSVRTNESLQDQYNVRFPLSTWRTYLARSEKRAAAPRRGDQQGRPPAPGPVAPEIDASIDASMRPPRTRGTAFEGCCPVACPAAGETVEEGDQPRVFPECPQQLCRPPKANLHLCGQEGPPELRASRGPPDGDGEPDEPREHLAATQAEGQQDLFSDGGGEANKAPGGPGDGSVSSDAEFTALLREAEAHDRLDCLMQRMCPWADKCASFPGSPKMSLQNCLETRGAHRPAGPPKGAVRSSHTAIPRWLEAALLESHEVLSGRNPEAFAADGETPSPEATQPVYVDPTHKTEHPPSPSSCSQRAASLERCSLLLQQAADNPQMMMPTPIAASFISNPPHAPASCTAAPQHTASKARGAQPDAANSSCSSKEAPHEPRPGRPRCRANHLGRPTPDTALFRAAPRAPENPSRPLWGGRGEGASATATVSRLLQADV